MSTVNPRLVDLVIGFEGFGAKAYICPGGKWTIGYGTTRWPDGRAVKEGDTVSREQARQLLCDHLAWVQDGVRKLVTAPVPEHVIEACVSLTYNIGFGEEGKKEGFSTSTCLKRLNQGNLKGAAEALRWWNKVTKRDGTKKVEGGLIARREAEADLLLNGWDGTANSDSKAQVIVEAPPTNLGSKTMQGVFQILAGLSIALVTATPEILNIWQTGHAVLNGQQGTALVIASLPMMSGVAQVWYARYQDWKNGKR
jgi:lysozyme